MYGPPDSGQPSNPNNDWGRYAPLVGVGLLVAGVLWEIFGQKKKVFISFDFTEDANYRRLLAAWDANTKFKFEFDDVSPRQAVDSQSTARIKAALAPMLKRASYLLVIVGEETHDSPWVAWEIDQAHEYKLKVVAVKIDRRYESPSGLLGAGTTWAYDFTRDAIVKALDSA